MKLTEKIFTKNAFHFFVVLKKMQKAPILAIFWHVSCDISNERQFYGELNWKGEIYQGMASSMFLVESSIESSSIKLLEFESSIE